MDDQGKKERKNKRIAWLTTVSVQLFLLVLFYFLIAWKAPFPPIPEYGIELGFEASAGSSAAPAVAQVPTEVPEVEEALPNASEVIAEETEADVAEVEEVVETAATEAIVQETAPAVEEQPVEEVKQEPAEEEVPAEEVAETTSAEEVEEPKIDPRGLRGSQGNITGSTEGASLALGGWMWDFKPRPEDDSSETGKIVYKIVVDQEGYLVRIVTQTSTVSPAVERKYRIAVEKLTFSKTSDYKPAPLSEGTITFIIKSK